MFKCWYAGLKTRPDTVSICVLSLSSLSSNVLWCEQEQGWNQGKYRPVAVCQCRPVLSHYRERVVTVLARAHGHWHRHANWRLWRELLGHQSRHSSQSFNTHLPEIWTVEKISSWQDRIYEDILRVLCKYYTPPPTLSQEVHDSQCHHHPHLQHIPQIPPDTLQHQRSYWILVSYWTIIS